LGDDELSAAPLARLAAVASILLRHAGAYGVLIRSDLDAARAIWQRRVIAGAVCGLSLLLALELACGALVAAAWNTPARGWVVGGLLALLTLSAGAAGWYLRSRPGTRAGASQTAREWAKDRALLGELIARLRAQAP
jgi:hypothetical protein